LPAAACWVLSFCGRACMYIHCIVIFGRACIVILHLHRIQVGWAQTKFCPCAQCGDAPWAEVKQRVWVAGKVCQQLEKVRIPTFGWRHWNPISFFEFPFLIMYLFFLFFDYVIEKFPFLLVCLKIFILWLCIWFFIFWLCIWKIHVWLCICFFMFWLCICKNSFFEYVFDVSFFWLCIWCFPFLIMYLFFPFLIMNSNLFPFWLCVWKFSFFNSVVEKFPFFDYVFESISIFV